MHVVAIVDRDTPSCARREAWRRRSGALEDWLRLALRRVGRQTAVEIAARHHRLHVAEIEDLGAALVVLVDQEEGRQRLRQQRIEQRRIAAEERELADRTYQQPRQRRAGKEVQLV